MEKTFNIIIKEDASFDEVTDTIADVFGAGIVINNALEDGFQLQDILAVIQVEPTIREVINDFPVFISQFQTLNGSTAITAVQAAKARTVAQFGDLGKVGTFIYDALIKIAGTFGFIEQTVVNGMIELEGWKSLLATIQKPE